MIGVWRVSRVPSVLLVVSVFGGPAQFAHLLQALIKVRLSDFIFGSATVGLKANSHIGEYQGCMVLYRVYIGAI